ncbi:hypothetical protein V6N11_001865 [Hibiscus sabdariffa]|uniref:Uncharacterized protein n=1 Tax=Hibiscus sabdariffa TaxID=183260 RepID=A0ABR2QTI7_9ROSI
MLAVSLAKDGLACKTFFKAWWGGPLNLVLVVSLDVFFTVYAPSDPVEQRQLWSVVESLKGNCQRCWFLGGDFIMVKIGQTKKSTRSLLLESGKVDWLGGL